MKCIICGTRDINDYSVIIEAIKESNFKITEIVSGNAHGVDRMAERYAKENNIPLHIFSAEWNIYGKYAGPIRNKKMIDFILPDGYVIAIWDGKSKGTKNTIELAKTNNLNLYIIII